MRFFVIGMGGMFSFVFVAKRGASKATEKR